MIERFVVDNSVVMSWCFKDESNPYADSILKLLKDRAVIVPPIWPLEVVNVLLVAERKKRLSESDSNRFIFLISQLPIFVEHERSEALMKEHLALARNCHLSSYDALYLALAMKMGVPLATLNKKLIAAAGKMKVPILAD
jgi:predicted nucleic acid-binding protein